MLYPLIKLYLSIAWAKDAVFIPLGKTATGETLNAGFKDMDEIKMIFYAQAIGFVVWIIKMVIDSWKNKNNKDSENLQNMMKAVDRIEQRLHHLEKKPDENHVRDLIWREMDRFMALKVK